MGKLVLSMFLGRFSWWVPFASQLSKEGFVEFWEAKDSKTFQYKPLCGDCNISWSFSRSLCPLRLLKVNFGQHVPVRVLYPESVFKRLVANIKLIPAEDRIGLLSDTFATSKAGALDAGFVVDLLSGFKDELNDKVCVWTGFGFRRTWEGHLSRPWWWYPQCLQGRSNFLRFVVV